MKAIINNKLYDTEKSKKIYDYRRKYNFKLFWTNDYVGTGWEEVEVYKTRKGNYFLLAERDSKQYIEIILEEEVKGIIKKLNPDEYMKIFGKKEIELA